MPNWCNNTVEIQSNEKFTKLLQSLVDDESSIEDFFKQTLQIDNSSDDDWYGANCRDIGCKWDIQTDVSFETSNIVFLSFDSAWSPPIAGIRQLAARHNLSLDFYYEESGELYIGRGTIDKNGYFSEEIWFGNNYLKGQYIINGIEHIYHHVDSYDNIDDFIKIWATDISDKDFKILKHALINEINNIVIKLLKL